MSRYYKAGIDGEEALHAYQPTELEKGSLVPSRLCDLVAVLLRFAAAIQKEPNATDD